jgi:nucleotide sugar dehydrogenase
MKIDFTYSLVSSMELKIQVIALGVVGSAQAYLLSQLQHDVYGYDPHLENKPDLGIVYQTELKKDVDITFICTPEAAVESMIRRLLNEKVRGLYVIKSSVPPGTTESLRKKYDIHICHNPEFLREEYSFEDVMNPNRILIGKCCHNHAKVLSDLYRPIKAPIFVATSTETETVKILSNVLRAYIITFWNHAELLCNKLGISAKKVATLLNQHKTLCKWEGGNWGVKYFGKPYDGKCLPKDVQQLIQLLDDLGLSSSVFKEIEKFNDKLALMMEAYVDWIIADTRISI